MDTHQSALTVRSAIPLVVNAILSIPLAAQPAMLMVTYSYTTTRAILALLLEFMSTERTAVSVIAAAKHASKVPHIARAVILGRI
jgi:hypothetical protein